MTYRKQFAGALAGAMLCGASGLPDVADAQTVTLYGVISTGLQYVSNSGGSKLFQVANGGMMQPRLGLKGDEDLGGGNHAIFTLENGFNIANGAMSGGMFGRQAFVGLSNVSMGQITMGRQYEEMTGSLWWALSANSFSGIGAHIGDNDNMFLTNRFNNSVRYQSPNLWGWTLAGMYAFSNSTSWDNNNGFSFSANYAKGPVRFGTAMTQFNRHSNASPGNLTSGAVDSTSWGFSSPFVVNSAGSGVEQQRILGVGGGYDFGLVNLTANYTNVLYNYTDTTGLRLQNAEVAASVRITPAWLIGATYIYTWGQYSTDKKPAWHQIDLGTLYSLSKRTDVFVTMIYQKAVGDAPFAEIYSLSKANGKSQAMVQLGMRHRF